MRPNDVEFRRCDDLAIEVLDDEALVWDGRASALHRLNSTATTILSACDRWNNSRAIARHVAVKSGCTPSDVESAVQACLDELERRHLVRCRAVRPE